ETWSRSGNQSGANRPRANAVGNPDPIVLGDPDHYFDTSAFVLPPQGTFGDAGRNTLTGPSYAMTNVSFVKNTRIGALGSGGQLQLRLEIFNLLNRANCATPDRVVFAAASA